MPSDLLRDSFFGHVCRLVSGGKMFQYPEEKDPSYWLRYINEDKSRNMALYGRPIGGLPGPMGDAEEDKKDEVIKETSDGAIIVESRSSGVADRAPDIELGPQGREEKIVDWDGPDDPENPRNWSTPKKVFVTFEICFLTFSVYIGSAIYAASILGVCAEFNVSEVAATLGLTMFVAGYAIGPMLWAPMSEIPQFGRNPVYILTLAVFVFLQIPTAKASSFSMLLGFRFLTGFVGSPSLATGGASIGDMYAPKQRTYAIALWGVGAVCGPTLGPLVGGFAVEKKGWQWAIWELMWLSAGCLVLLVFFLPETSSSNILFRRARRLRKLTGEKVISEPELFGEHITGKDVAMMTMVKPFALLITEPIILALDMYIALIYGVLYIWFECFPIVFVTIYHFSLGTLGLAYLGLLSGIFIVVAPFAWYHHKYTCPKFNDDGELKPEWRLPPAFFGAFAIPICLFWFGWTARPSVHWIVPIIGTAWFSSGAFLLFNSVLNYLGDAYPHHMASVMAGNDFLRSSVGAGFPLFATAMFKKLGVDWASSLLGFLSIAFIPIPFLLFKYGHVLRQKSRYARKDI